MDEDTAESIANREEPIPVIRLRSREDEPTTPASETEQKLHTKDKLKGHADKLKDQASKLKGRLEEYGSPEVRQSLQDRFFSGVMSQIIPPEEVSETEDDGRADKKPDVRSRQYVDRPGFSIPAMSNNFRRFNARVGVLFALQNRLIHLFTWRHPTATMSFLGVYTLLCLNPHLLPVVPLVGVLFWIMIPSFLARHPASTNDPRMEPSFRGPPVAPPSRVKPAPEMSKDFFRNMRDLQNSMEDFSRVHDAANEQITPYTNFSDEGMSSLLFVSLFSLCCVAFFAADMVPWKLVLLVAGWAAVISGHPEAQKIMESSSNASQMRHHATGIQEWLRSLIAVDIVLDDPPQVRQVEIFELQKYHIYSDTWEAWLFSPSPYDPLSPARISGTRAKGTQFFEDVQPPTGWIWKDKKWGLDFLSREWVEQRMISGVQIETEGERWVYDIPKEELDMLESSAKAKKGKKAKEVPKSGWEEGTGLEKVGEWRRRRWVRLVERKVVKDDFKAGG